MLHFEWEESWLCDAKAAGPPKDKAAADLGEFFDLMEDAISGRASFLEGGFSALDYYLSMLTEWPSNRQDLLAAHPKIRAVYHATSQRPGYRSAMNRHALPEVAA